MEQRHEMSIPGQRATYRLQRFSTQRLSIVSNFPTLSQRRGGTGVSLHPILDSLPNDGPWSLTGALTVTG